MMDRQHCFWPFLLLVTAFLAGSVWNARIPWSPNDKSRWNTVWSLVEHGTYQIFDTAEEAQRRQVPVQFETIDKIAVRDESGYRYYSSKPALLPTVLAGFVRLMKPVVGEEFGAGIQIYGKAAILVFQLVPFAIFLVLYRRFLDRYARTEFAWWWSLACAAVGTYVTGYLVTLNNHVIAASFGFFTAYLLVTIWYEGRREWWRFLLAGLCAGWTAANELPAALLALVAAGLAFLASRRQAVLGFLPALALVAAAYLAAHHAAIGRELAKRPAEGDARSANTLRAYLPIYVQRDLYDYPGSYWKKSRQEGKSGIDALNEEPESRLVYFLNMTIGHKGIFSLTPIWILALWGAVLDLARRDERLPGIAWPIAIVSAVVFCFYWLVTDQRNYGGGGHGIRWLLWLGPLWLLFLPLAADRLASSPLGRWAAWICLAVSTFSMAGTFSGPWGRSWLQRLFQYLGVIEY